LKKISNNIYNTCSNKKTISVTLSLNPDEVLNKSEEEFVIIIDNNITFMKGFDEKIIEILSSSKKSIFTFPYCDEIKNKVYYPGGFVLFSNKKIMNPYLLTECQSKNEIPCVINGIYAFNREWYDHIIGAKGIIGPSGIEVFLSIKSYLAGGNCKLNKNIKFGYNFYENKNQTKIQKKDIYYNKLFLCNTILPMELSTILLNLLPKNKEKEDAINLFKQNSKEIFRNRIAYEDILTTPFADYVKKFNLV
jgi:hypothetical protein